MVECEKVCMSTPERDERRSRAPGWVGGCICALPQGKEHSRPPPLQAGPLQLNVHALLLAANADKLLLDLQQAAVYFQHQKQVLQGVSVQLLLDRFGGSHPCGGGGGGIAATDGQDRQPPTTSSGLGNRRGTFGTAHSSPHQKPRRLVTMP